MIVLVLLSIILLSILILTAYFEDVPLNTTLRNEDFKSFDVEVSESLPLLVAGPEPLIPESIDLCNPSEFQKKSGLFCIITGIEHSGTTMTSSLVMNAPNLYGAFELGILMAKTPRDFREGFFFDGITKPTTSHFWGLTEHQREQMQAASCVAEQYNIVRKYSPIYEALNTSWLVDKTPAYYRDLYAIMQRTPKIPFVVTQKNDDSIRKSLTKRNTGRRQIEKMLKNFHRQLNLAKKHFPERLFVLNYTSFEKDPNRNMNELFSFLGLRWDPSYLSNHPFNEKGKLFGTPPVPAFNSSRSDCDDCVTDPYGKGRG